MTTIVIFGAAVRPGGLPSPVLRRRTEAAFRCGGPGARYIPTGAVGRHPPSEAAVMAQLLTGWGVPEHAITLEETGTDTLSSARACAALLRDAADVRVATSAYHLPRCLLLLRLEGVRARACKPPASAPLWWWLRESLALPVDLLLSVCGRRA